jgi:multiple antibiotic resistance protein
MVTLNPLGNVPVFIAMLRSFPPKQQRKIIVRELLMALAILMVFSLSGNWLLTLFGFDITLLRIAGGVLLVFVALAMIFPKQLTTDQLQQEPFLVPLAIPLVTGPAAISTAILLAESLQNNWLMAMCVFLGWLPAFLAIYLSSALTKLLGEKVLLACERIFGMVLMFIAIQMIINGTLSFYHSLVPAVS